MGKSSECEKYSFMRAENYLVKYFELKTEYFEEWDISFI